ncbi:MAG: diadenylate cyclase CdaA [Christensenellaceae bacterium]|nr:diadenylate cyclase CdaA [Christensenellaceae bacterium]MBR3843279.1 diadenylate cyclase CdaA [Christensenellaceae bacterium]
MGDLFSVIKSSIIEIGIKDIIDIILISFILYGIYKITKGTRASQVLKGVGVIILAAWFCEAIGLTAVSWILNYLIAAGGTIVVVLFQPEIRRALERIGTRAHFDLKQEVDTVEAEEIIEQIQRSILNMSIKKTGALMVFERSVGLNDVVETGTTVDARISSELIENIFFINAPMHDGAMILRGMRIQAAGCFLPLSDNKQISSELGTRHRAALGISEVSDSITIVVSEETGVISMTKEGVLTRYLDRKKLNDVLREIFGMQEVVRQPFRVRIRNRMGIRK